jgi:hypothetical protein
VLSTWRIVKRESETVQHVNVVFNGSETETETQSMVLKGASEENGEVMETVWSDLVGSEEGIPSPGGVRKPANFQNIDAICFNVTVVHIVLIHLVVEVEMLPTKIRPNYNQIGSVM